MELKTKINKKLKSPIQQLSRISREKPYPVPDQFPFPPGEPPSHLSRALSLPIKIFGGPGVGGGLVGKGARSGH